MEAGEKIIKIANQRLLFLPPVIYSREKIKALKRDKQITTKVRLIHAEQMSLYYLITEKTKDTTEEIIHENLIYREQ